MRGGLETPVDSWNGQGEQLVVEQRQRNTVISFLRPQAIRQPWKRATLGGASEPIDCRGYRQTVMYTMMTN
jgi:hypothetical protein